MELVCQRCGQRIKVPDEWAGRAVRCKGCNKVVRVPTILAEDEDVMDLDSLATYEPAGGGDDETANDWVDFQAIGDGQKRDVGPAVRVCPECRSTVKDTNPETAIICSNCGADVPPTAAQPVATGVAAKRGRGSRPRVSLGMPGAGQQTFYEGALSTLAYPISAANSILGAMVVAIGVILLPVGVMLLVAGALSAEPVRGFEFESTWAKQSLFVMFSVELLYFLGVAFYAFIDSTRNTAAGTERPPELTWNLITVGQALLGYVAILVYYGVILAAMVMAGNHGRLVIPDSMAELKPLLSTPNLVLLAILTLMVPMNLIGLASGKFIDGINPVKAMQSIIRAGGHYVFLFCVDGLYISLYAFGMVSLLSWTGKRILHTLEQGMDQSIGSLAMGLVLWGVLIGVGIYFAYAMGRLHGLFARTYRQYLRYDI